jgi:hypothetical protein
MRTEEELALVPVGMERHALLTVTPELLVPEQT